MNLLDAIDKALQACADGRSSDAYSHLVSARRLAAEVRERSLTVRDLLELVGGDGRRRSARSEDHYERKRRAARAQNRQRKRAQGRKRKGA